MRNRWNRVLLAAWRQWAVRGLGSLLHWSDADLLVFFTCLSQFVSLTVHTRRPIHVCNHGNDDQDTLGSSAPGERHRIESLSSEFTDNRWSSFTGDKYWIWTMWLLSVGSAGGFYTAVCWYATHSQIHMLQHFIPENMLKLDLQYLFSLKADDSIFSFTER